MSEFNETRKALDTMDDILNKLRSIKAPNIHVIEDHFTRYMVIVFYREVEEKYKEIIRKKSNKFDNQIFKILTRGDNIEALLETFKKSKPDKTLKVLGFGDDIDSILSLFGNFIEARMVVAHHCDRGIEVSWGEINGEVSATNGKKIDEIGAEVTSAIEQYFI